MFRFPEANDDMGQSAAPPAGVEIRAADLAILLDGVDLGERPAPAAVRAAGIRVILTSPWLSRLVTDSFRDPCLVAGPVCGW